VSTGRVDVLTVLYDSRVLMTAPTVRSSLKTRFAMNDPRFALPLLTSSLQASNVDRLP